MYETERGDIGPSEVSVTDFNREPDGSLSETECNEFAGESVIVFLLKTKKNNKSRSKPGNDEPSKRGEVANSQRAP